MHELVYESKQKHEEFTVSGDSGESNQDKEAGMARELVRQIQILRKEKECKMDEHIAVGLAKEHKNLRDELLLYIRKETLADTITWEETLTISTLPKAAI